MFCGGVDEYWLFGCFLYFFFISLLLVFKDFNDLEWVCVHARRNILTQTIVIGQIELLTSRICYACNSWFLHCVLLLYCGSNIYLEEILQFVFVSLVAQTLPFKLISATERNVVLLLYLLVCFYDNDFIITVRLLQMEFLRFLNRLYYIFTKDLNCS